MAGRSCHLSHLLFATACPLLCAMAHDVPVHSVSGVSSGGSMAINHFVAFSSVTEGAMIAAGSPYGCNIVEKDATDYCGSGGWPKEKEDELDEKVRNYLHERAEKQLIDPLSSMKGRRVYLYSGHYDDVVNTSVLRAISRQLSPWTGEDAIHEDFDTPSTHGWAVDGSDCGHVSSDPCSKCCCDPDLFLKCKHDVSGLLLSHILRRPLPEQKGKIDKSNLLKVRQHRYVPENRTAKDTGIWHTGYVYAPKACRGKQNNTQCSVHVNYHGCVWGVLDNGLDSLFGYGLMEWAEALNVVLVFPQSSHSVDDGACWDWTGETDSLFDTKQGPQLDFVMLFLADLRRILEEGGDEVALV